MSDLFRLIRIAILSRFIIWVIGLVGIFVQDYDTSAHISYQLDESMSSIDMLVRSCFGMFANWDGIYFLEISSKGYQFEQFHAFFPLYPFLIRQLGKMGEILTGGVLSPQSAVLLASFLSSNGLFVLAAVMLYRLTLLLFRSDSFALVTAILFCFNPASVFMSAGYTESLFACSVFGGLNWLVSGNRLIASLLFGVAAASRSNGTVLLGFIVWDMTVDMHRRRLWMVWPQPLLQWPSTSPMVP